MRRLSYALAINEAFHQIMVADARVIQIGVGVNTPFYVGNTMTGLLDRFGPGRMIDTPVSENGVTGVAVGAAITGLRPILTFPRMDFMHYAMDQLCNHAALLDFTLGGNTPVPLTIRAMINRGGEQGAQHSQATQAFFMHVPGLRVVAPANARDAKGMLAAAVDLGSPVLFVEDRWLYRDETEVPEELYTVPLTGASVLREGRDMTLVASSHMVTVCLKAAAELAADGIDAEVIDLRVLKPLDEETLLRSVSRTGRVLVVDGGWKTCGVSAEVSAVVATGAFGSLRVPVRRIALPDTPAPASRPLEAAYYPDAAAVQRAAREMLRGA
jgi:acetoin:2,6-dichlorophenolindophenol oxidoreductase subunit beta